ncbi:hypothetical protein PR048_028930 [Dryococelus australis]|uniref:Uncharacterized protein n=1 Tax=Dryococelus australis TaxID=614101 RepID=A0ABQ9GBX9_9NEOP|nr:hypothetical protein PR048_028930 [Dryococelus australis]
MRAQPSGKPGKQKLPAAGARAHKSAIPSPSAAPGDRQLVCCSTARRARKWKQLTAINCLHLTTAGGGKKIKWRGKKDLYNPLSLLPFQPTQHLPALYQAFPPETEKKKILLLGNPNDIKNMNSARQDKPNTERMTEIPQSVPELYEEEFYNPDFCLLIKQSITLFPLTIHRRCHVSINFAYGAVAAAVAQRFACSPHTKANQAQSPAGSLPNFRKWLSCRTMPLVGGFSRGSPVSPVLLFQRCSILTSITLIGSQDLAHPNVRLMLTNEHRETSELLKTSMSQCSGCQLRQLTSTLFRSLGGGGWRVQPFYNLRPRRSEVCMEQRRNEGAGEKGDLRENPPTSVIVDTIPTCENLPATPLGIGPGSPLVSIRVTNTDISRATVVERLVCSPPTKANRVQSPAGQLPDFCMWESSDDNAGRRVFSGISRFFHPFIPVPLHTDSITSIDSQDHAVKSCPNLFTPFCNSSFPLLLGLSRVVDFFSNVSAVVAAATFRERYLTSWLENKPRSLEIDDNGRESLRTMQKSPFFGIYLPRSRLLEQVRGTTRPDDAKVSHVAHVKAVRVRETISEYRLATDKVCGTTVPGGRTWPLVLFATGRDLRSRYYLRARRKAGSTRTQRVSQQSRGKEALPWSPAGPSRLAELPCETRMTNCGHAVPPAFTRDGGGWG